jgi:hypothetical protein
MSNQILDAVLFKRLMDYASENNINLDDLFDQKMLNPLQVAELNQVNFPFTI